MPTAEIDFTMNFELDQQNEADKKLFAVFYKDVIKNEPKSAEAGRPIFDEVDLIRIMTPGSRDTFVGRADDEYQQRFPQQWARYKAKQDQNMTGTPLNQLSWLSIGQIAEFNAVGCYTVEHLVNMSDALSQKFMGHFAIKQKAQQYLEAAQAAAPLSKMQQELQKRDDEIAELNRKLNLVLAEREAEKATKVPATKG